MKIELQVMKRGISNLIINGKLLFQSEYLNETQFQSLNSDIVEINKILASIIISTKNNLKK